MHLFWCKVDIKEEADCWNWTASTNKQGYGRFRYQGKKVGAHRLSWQIANGDIPEGLCVLHRCDNPKCCNPKHLFVGTRSDNMQDMVLKGRKHLFVGEDNYFSTHTFPQNGETNPQSKLQEDQVINIRKLFLGGTPQPKIGDIYGISQTHVSNICSNKRWRHL